MEEDDEDDVASQRLVLDSRGSHLVKDDEISNKSNTMIVSELSDTQCSDKVCHFFVVFLMSSHFVAKKRKMLMKKTQHIPLGRLDF